MKPLGTYKRLDPHVGCTLRPKGLLEVHQPALKEGFFSTTISTVTHTTQPWAHSHPPDRQQLLAACRNEDDCIACCSNKPVQTLLCGHAVCVQHDTHIPNQSWQVHGHHRSRMRHPIEN